MKRRKITRRVLVLLCLPLLLALTPAVGLADGEPVPMAPRGYVEINGEEAPDGTEITAKVWGPGGWWIYGPCLTVDGYYDFYDCGATIPVPPYGANSLVRFMVWGIEDRDVSMQWQSGTTTVGSEGDPFSITKAHLDVEITEPDDGDTFSTEQVYTVTARITNNGMETATDVDGHIDFSANASAGTPFAEGLTIPVGESVDYSWPVTCTGPGSTDIEVTVSGQTPYSPKDPHSTATVPIPATNLGDDAISVNQEEKIHLAVTNVWTDLPEVNHASTEQVFHVMATVENEIQQVGLDPAMKAVAEDVMATLVATTGSVDIGDPTPASEDFLAGGEVVTFTWEVTCTGWGDVAFEVIPAGEDENTDAQVLPDNVEIGEYDVIQEEKIHLAVTDVWTDLPEVDHASTEQVFHVMATVENEIQDPLLTDVAYKAVAEDVMATLVALTGSVDIGDPVPSSEDFLAGGDVVTFTWTVTCTDWGDVLFEVTPAGEDENTDAQVKPLNIEKGNYTVIQEEKIHLTVTDVWTDLPEVNHASTEQVFHVMATVKNEIQDPLLTDVAYKAVAEDVMATLVALTGSVDIGDPVPSSEDFLAGDAEVTFTWTVTCTDWGDVLFEVTPAGEDENTDAQVLPHNIEKGNYTVIQEEKIHLAVTNIWTSLPNEPEASTEQVFTVYASVENEIQDPLLTDPVTYKAVAEDVVATLTATGDVVIEQALSSVEPDLIGGEDVTFSWVVTCTGPTDVLFSVMPAGEDENTDMQVKPLNVEPDDFEVVQEWKAGLTVEIVEPPYGRTFSSDQVFLVEAVITNTGEADAVDVVALLEPLIGDAVLEGDVVTKTVDRIPGYSSAVVTWTLKCIGSEQVHLWVTATGIDENTAMPIHEEVLFSDDTIVNQEWKAHLYAEIIAPEDGATFTEGQIFTVIATVEQLGEAIAEDPELELQIEGDAVVLSDNPHTFNDMELGDFYQRSWTVECTASGPVTLTVMPSAIDENTDADAFVTPASITVMQQTAPHLVADITAPVGDVSTEQPFVVSVDIANTGEADAVDVEVELEIVSGPAEFAGSETAVHTISVIPGEDSVTESWTLNCTDVGEVTITVTPSGKDGNTGLVVMAEGDTIVVMQVKKAHLVATVEAPGWVKLGEEFTVSATIENTGEAAALDVSALLSIDGHAELVLGEIDEKLADPSTVAGSGSVEITWTLVCTDIGPVTLTVEPDGTDENTGAAIPEDNLEAGMLTINQVYQVYLPFVGVDHHTP